MKDEKTGEYLLPDWPAPDNIIAFTTSRKGGLSASPYDSLNLGLHVGDDSAVVENNRLRMLGDWDGLEQIQWLQQVHGEDIVMARGLDYSPEADGAVSDQPGLACAVMTADCLPLLFCNRQGTRVAAVHAGWRGMVKGVIEQAVSRFSVSSEDLLVWLGPAISQPHFEVGADVREQFLQASAAVQRPQIEAAFQSNPLRDGHYFADLYALARNRLAAMGVTAVYGGEHCSYADPSRFYSYRRDGITGRMVSLIYIKA